MHKIVVMGGGTGSYAVLSGLKHLADIALSAIVASTDSGGSTGRLKDEFGPLPVGDLRQCISALAENKDEQALLRDLFQYRFNKGEDGLRGHNLGNLLLTAMREIVGDDLQALSEMKKLFNMKGDVYPITLEKCELVAEYENGEVLRGEKNIDEPGFPHDGRLHITKLSVEPNVSSHASVHKVIEEADIIILGPGDLYTSIAANLVINDIPSHIKKSHAKLIYIPNLVTKFGQTYNFAVSDHVHEVEKYAKKSVDYILVNTALLPDDILKKYHKENAFAVENDIKNDKRVIEADLLASDEVTKPSGDIVRRSLIRHDGTKIANAIRSLLM